MDCRNVCSTGGSLYVDFRLLRASVCWRIGDALAGNHWMNHLRALLFRLAGIMSSSYQSANIVGVVTGGGHRDTVIIPCLVRLCMLTLLLHLSFTCAPSHLSPYIHHSAASFLVGVIFVENAPAGYVPLPHVPL